MNSPGTGSKCYLYLWIYLSFNSSHLPCLPLKLFVILPRLSYLNFCLPALWGYFLHLEYSKLILSRRNDICLLRFTLLETYFRKHSLNFPNWSKDLSSFSLAFWPFFFITHHLKSTKIIYLVPLSKQIQNLFIILTATYLAQAMNILDNVSLIAF